jgi:hypothetical protein
VKGIMNYPIQVICSSLAVFLLVAGVSAQEQAPAKPTVPEKQSTSPRVFGQSYATLLPEQKKLLDDFVRRYNQTTGSKIIPEQAYDGARVSVRTTFDAVTHALLSTKITNEKGQSLGRALDLVDAMDEVMGEEAGAGGDRQFRMYVYLKPNAVDTLSSSNEFFHDKDNTVYHKGFPICFRLKNGPPSIQFSISRDERMSDIDVDYRASTFPKALFDGHLTAGNSDVRAGHNLDTHDNRWAGLNGWWRQVFEGKGNAFVAYTLAPNHRASTRSSPSCKKCQLSFCGFPFRLEPSREHGGGTTIGASSVWFRCALANAVSERSV